MVALIQTTHVITIQKLTASCNKRQMPLACGQKVLDRKANQNCINLAYIKCWGGA